MGKVIVVQYPRSEATLMVPRICATKAPINLLPIEVFCVAGSTPTPSSRIVRRR